MANRVLDLKNYFGVINRDDAYLYTDVAGFDSLIYNSAAPACDYKAVKNAIRNILEFRLGDRPLNPNFGNTLHKFVYEPNNSNTINKLNICIQNLLASDSRIIIHDIATNISDTNTDLHNISINIVYSIAGLDNSTDVYSFSIN
jgi:phage baseplate assembly protein W